MLKCKQLLSTVLVVMLLFTSMVFAENENGVFDTEAILNSLGNGKTGGRFYCLS